MQSISTPAPDDKIYTPVVKYAHFEGVYGVAYRDSRGAAWFLAEGDTVPTLLHQVDVPHLDLHGQLDLIQAQAFQDARFGTLLDLIDYRQSEHAQAA